MTRQEFFEGFLKACNSNPLRELAFTAGLDGVTEDDVADWLKCPELCNVPEPLKASFRNKFRDLGLPHNDEPYRLFRPKRPGQPGKRTS